LIIEGNTESAISGNSTSGNSKRNITPAVIGEKVNTSTSSSDENKLKSKFSHKRKMTT
jgi:hypothetical protein